MTHVIGEGVETLYEWMQKCKNAGGSPLIRTRFVKEFTSDVIVACYMAGSKVKGGTIEDIPNQLIDELRQVHGEKRLEVVAAWLRAHGGGVPQAAVATI